MVTKILLGIFIAAFILVLGALAHVIRMIRAGAEFDRQIKNPPFGLSFWTKGKSGNMDRSKASKTVLPDECESAGGAYGYDRSDLVQSLRRRTHGSIGAPFLSVQLPCGCSKSWTREGDIPHIEQKCIHGNHFISYSVTN